MRARGGRIGTAGAGVAAAAVSGVLLMGDPAAGALGPGDIAIIGFNSSGTDGMAIVALVDVPGGEPINFTDGGWLASGGFRQGEGTDTYTAPAGGLARGSIVQPAVSAMSLSAEGDQILAYQGPVESPSFLYAVNFDSTGWADATSAHTTALPPGLTEGTTAVNLGETDNGLFRTNTLATGTQAEWLAAIGNPVNWTKSNDPLTMPGGALRVGTASGLPAVTIVDPAVPWLRVSSGVGSYAIRGAASSGTVGRLAWTNSLTRASGSVPASESWTVTVALGLGANAVTLTGTNTAGQAASDAVTIGRFPADVGNVWVNELHYDNAGADSNEGVEIAGPAGLDLARYSLVLYNGGTGIRYHTRALSGTIDCECEGYGAVWFAYPASGLQNGNDANTEPDGVALVCDGVYVLQFLSYEGSFEAVDGPAAGLRSTNIGVWEPNTTAAGLSLHAVGAGSRAEDFSWTGPADDSPGVLNAGQSIRPPGTLLLVR